MSEKELDEAIQAKPGSHIRYGVETVRTVKGRKVIMTKNARVKSVDASGKVTTHDGVELDPSKKVASRSNIEQHHDWHIIKEGRTMHFLRDRENLTEKSHVVRATYSGGDAGKNKTTVFRTNAPTAAGAKNKVGLHLSRQKYRVHSVEVVREEIEEVDEGKTYRVDPEDVKGSKRSKSALKRRDNDDRARGSSKRSVEEEVEQLDEIGDTAMGKITLKNYIKKAAASAADHRTVSLNHYRNASLDKDPDEIRKQNDLGNKRGRKAHDRLKGVDRAVDRLSKHALKTHEEVEIDEKEDVSLEEGKTYRSEGDFKSKAFRDKMRKFSSSKRKASVAKREVSED